MPDDPFCLFGITVMFVGKAFTRGVDLNAAFHHQRPGYQRPLRMRHRTMSLIARHVCQPGPEGVPPDHSLALIAGMTKIQRIGHFRNMLADKRRIPPIAVTGQHKAGTADILRHAVRGDGAHAAHFAGGIGIESLDLLACRDIEASRRCGLQQGRLQGRARAFWHGMHAQHRMAGI